MSKPKVERKQQRCDRRETISESNIPTIKTLVKLQTNVGLFISRQDSFEDIYRKFKLVCNFEKCTLQSYILVDRAEQC